MRLSLNSINVNMLKKFKQIRSLIILWNNQRRSFVRVEIRNNIPRLIIHEKYERFVSWGLRGLTFVGILSCLVSMTWYSSLTFTIILLLFERLLEKTIFTYTSIYVQPFIEYDSNEWMGMVFCFPAIPKKGDVLSVGMVFRSEQYCKKMLKYIRSMNYDQDIDNEDNINLSFIIENNVEYSTYLYPSFERETVKLAKKQVERENIGKKDNKEHEQMIMGLIMCKRFPYSDKSNFKHFQSIYVNGDPFELATYYFKTIPSEINEGRPCIMSMSDVGQPSDIKPVVKYTIKIKKRSELTDKDIEYQHGKMVIR